MGIIVVAGTVINNTAMTAGNVPTASAVSVVTNGLQLYYDASVASSITSTSVTDLSGNSKTGTLTAAGMYSSGINGGVFTFNGTNQILDTTYTPSYIWSIQQAFYNTDNYLVWNRGLFSTYNPSGPYDGLYIGTGNSYIPATAGFHYYADNNTEVRLTPQSTWVINTWYIITAVSNGSNVSIYLNGNTTPINSYAVATSNKYNLVIGQTRFNAGAGGDFWKGYIANTLVYNKALSVSEITQNYNALKGRFGLT
jgi:hypothetical protein